MAVVLQEMLVRLGLDIDGFTNGIDKSLASMGSFGKGIMKSMDFMTSPAGAIAGITAFGTAAFVSAELFDKAGDDIAIKSGALGATLAGLEKSFANTFAQVPNDAAQVATAISDLNVKLGLTGPPLDSMAVQFLTIGRLMKEEVGPLVSSVTDAFKKWGVELGDQPAKLELLQQAARSSGFSVSGLADALATFAPALQAAGMNLDSSIALLGSLKLAGQDVDSLMPALTKSITAMAKAGINPDEGFPALVARIRDARSETEAIALAGAEFGTRGGLKFVQAIRSMALETGAFSLKLAANGETIAQVAAKTDDFGEKWATTWHGIQAIIKPAGNVIRFVLDQVVAEVQAFIKVWDYLGGLVSKTSFLYQAFNGGSKTLAAGQGAVTKAVNASAVALKAAGVQTETATEKTKRLKEEQTAAKKAVEEQEKALKKLSDEMANDLSNAVYFAKAHKDLEEKARAAAAEEKRLTEQLAALDVEMRDLARSTPMVSAETQKMLDAISSAGIAASGINALGDAYRTLGITVTTADLQKKADDLRAAYGQLALDSPDDLLVIQQAWVKVEEADKAALSAVGKWTPAMEEALQASKTKLAAMEGHVEPLKNKWTELGASIKGSVGGAIDDMVKMLFDGDMSFGERMKTMLKDIGISVVEMFIKPAKEAIATFISETITDLLSGKGLGGVLQNVKDIGSTMADVFGGGAKTASGVAGGAGGAAGGIGGAVSGAGGGASGAAGGIAGAFNIAGAIGSLVGAGAAVAGDVILARIHTDTGRIEESARYSMLTLGGRGGGIFESVRWINDALGWNGALASLLGYVPNAIYDLQDITRGGFASLDVMVRDNLVPDLRAIREASGGPSVSIVNNIAGNVIGNEDFLDQLANALAGRLRLQGASA